MNVKAYEQKWEVRSMFYSSHDKRDLLKKGACQLDLDQEDFSSKQKSRSKGTEAELTMVDPEDNQQLR